MSPFKIMAHRGASADAADNTTQAFQLAIDQRADMIETDVRITADGVLILAHDEDYGGLMVAEATLTEIREVKPDLLTAATALAQFGARIPFCWELKAPKIEAALVNLIRDLTPESIWRQTEFTSFIFKTVVSVQTLVQETSTVSVGWLTTDWNEAVITRVYTAHLSQICPPADRILQTPHLVEIAHMAGLKVRAWKITAPELVPQLADLGVDGGTVNFPERAVRALNH